MTVEAIVHDLLVGVVEQVGVELIDVEYAGGSLRVTVDAEGGVTTEQLAQVNRLVSPILDQHDPIPGRYTLEVSSPGLERPLRTPAHFARAVGEQVVIKRGPDAEPRRLRGTLTASDDTTATVEVVEIDGVELAEPAAHQVELATVDSARTVFDWGPQPKPGQPKSGQPKSGRPKQQKKKQKSGPSKQNDKSSQPRGAR
ncbi:MAG: ribosome maturation factor RimP [Actinomycetota bacterium]